MLLLFCVLAWGVPLAPARAISITWDYTCDSDGFFTSQRRAVLEAVASVFSNYEIDRPALAPTGGNQWSWNFNDPSGSGAVEILNPSVGAGELVIYVGAKDLGAGTLGLGGNVGWGASGSGTWIQSLQNTNTESAYQPFGGTLSLNTTVFWYDGLSSTVPAGQFDFFTIALHEVGHVLGVGLYDYVDAWDLWVNTGNNTFFGSRASEIYGSAVPLSSTWSHIQSGTTYEGLTPVMVPTISAGVRREWTAVEFGILEDLGYVAIPEPHLWVLVPFIAGWLFRTRRRQFPKTA